MQYIKLDTITDQIKPEIYDTIEAMNYSGLKEFLVSPAHYKHSISTQDDSDNPAFKIGRALHMAVFQPMVYGNLWAVAPECDRRTTAGKLIWSTFQAENLGKEVLTSIEADLVASMADKVKANQFFKDTVTQFNLNECGIYTNLWGSNVKGRLDTYDPINNVIFDLKSIKVPPTAKAMRHEIFARGYHLQSALYKEMVHSVTKKMPKFIFGFVEKNKPHSVNFATIGQTYHHSACIQIQTALCRYENCKAENKWFGFDNEFEPLVISPDYGLDDSVEIGDNILDD
jgi:hypothetical protein